jgi:C4-dicarboxylate-specific signal transduction histidine kinase
MYVADAEAERLAELLAAGGRIRDLELELRARGGKIRQAALAADTVEMGGEPCFITFIRDVTEHKRAESEAQQQRLEAAHLSRVAMLGELSGSLAHELNQPLTAILANARAAQRLLASGPPDLTDLREILEDIAQDDRRAGEVIHRLRAFLKKGDAHLRLIDLNEVVEEVLELVHSDLVQRMIRVDAHLAPSLPPVLADRVQLQQVLLNLLLNACDAVGAKPRAQRRLTIVVATIEEGAVQLSLADQGTGIPEELLSRAFEPFVTTKAHGLGLGLAICRSIVTAHGGRLWAENNPEGGATFHLVLHGAEATAHA